MKLTEKYIKQKFTEYNALYFNSELQMCKFGLQESYRQLGSFSYRVNRWERKKTTYKTIYISRKYDFSEEDFRDVLVHEMIHYYLAHKFFFVDAGDAHGKPFVEMMNEMKARHNLNIRITHDQYALRLSDSGTLLGRFLCTLF